MEILSPHNTEMLLRFALSLIAGAAIGYERTYHGRPAGFRTHALVCSASCLLMFITAYESDWVNIARESIRLDPTRMAQGIMTGIGFLGAGVIIKEGLSVRGLTTAASIWMTAVVGILAGVGFYFPLVLGALSTLGVLASFRWLERRMPSQSFYIADVQLAQDSITSEDDLRKIVEECGFSISGFSYQMKRAEQLKGYGMTVHTFDRKNASKLYQEINAIDSVLNFKILPAGDK